MNNNILKPHMTMEITDELIEKAHMRLVKARMSLLFKNPFFVQIALRLKLTPADRKWCETAATDGRKFYYNPAFVANLDDKELVFLVVHEVGHCIYEHFLRRPTDVDPKLWNIAGDYIINNMIENEIVKKGDYACVITYVKPYLDHKYDGWTTEEVCADLIEQQKNGNDPSKDGDLIDVHIDLSAGGGSGDEGDDESGGQSDGGLAGKPGPLSEDEREQLKNELTDALIQAAQAVGADDVPGDFKRMISDLLEPKMDWREFIRAQIESLVRSDFTFMNPNRKGWHMNAILPGMKRDQKIDIALCIDTSGSISQNMLRDFVSEVAGIMEQYDDYRIRIWQFDTTVYGYEEFTQDDGKDIREYQIRGGGGTDFEVNWKFMKEKDITPEQLIMFTDGQPYGSWGDPDYVDTIFLIHSTDKTITAPFGQTVHYTALGK